MSAEQAARQNIDEFLRMAGWHVCDVAAADLHAARGVAIREFPLAAGFGFADYLLYVDGKAAGVIEAKKAGATLTGVEIQSGQIRAGPAAISLPAWRRPLPFLLRIHRRRDAFHQRARPRAARAQCLRLSPSGDAGRMAAGAAAGDCAHHGRRRDGHEARRSPRHVPRPRPLRCPTRRPTAGERKLWPAQITAIQNLEKSLAARQAARADPDGDRLRQDLYRHQLHLPADQVRRRAARAVPGGPRQPRPADQEGVRPVRLALQQLQVRRGVHRPAPQLATTSTRPPASSSAPSSACTRCSRGASWPEEDEERSSRRLRKPVQGHRAPIDYNPAIPDRDLRHHRHRRSATAPSTTCGGRCWNTSTPT